MNHNGDTGRAHAQDEVMFIVIGAQKAGTTWLHSYLSQHPQVSTGPLKEYHYFNKFHREFAQGSDRPALQGARRVLARASMLRRAGSIGHVASIWAALRGQGDYLQMVRGDNADAHAFGDVTPIYGLLGRDAFAEMATQHPNMRFVFVMRDPVDRLWSHTRMRARRLKLSPGDAGFDALIQSRLEEKRFLGRSDYARTITELEAAVPQGQILYLFYEELFSDERLHELCNFLGLDFVPGHYDEKVFAGMVADAPEAWLTSARQRLAPVYEFVSQRFGARVPQSWLGGVSQDAPAAKGVA